MAGTRFALFPPHGPEPTQGAAKRTPLITHGLAVAAVGLSTPSRWTTHLPRRVIGLDCPKGNAPLEPSSPMISVSSTMLNAMFGVAWRYPCPTAARVWFGAFGFRYPRRACGTFSPD